MSAVLQNQPDFEPMGEGDLDAVLEVERRIYEFPWTPGNFHDSIRAGYSCWVCRNGEGVLSYAVTMLAAGEAHLLNLSVDTAFRRRGHATRLLQYLVAVARAQGARILFLEVRPSNAAGLELYLRNGFCQVGVRRNYYPAQEGREDAFVLALEL